MKRLWILLLLLVIFCCAFQKNEPDDELQTSKEPFVDSVKDYFSEKMEDSVYKDLSLTNGALGFPPISGKLVLAMIVSVTAMFAIIAFIGKGKLEPNAQNHGKILLISAVGKEKSLDASYWVHRDTGNAWTSLEGAKDPSELQISAVLTSGLQLSNDGILKLKKEYRSIFQKSSRYKVRTDFMESAVETLDDAFFENGIAPLGASALLLSFCKKKIYWASVGNIFLYLLRDGEMIQINRTHTMADVAALHFINGEDGENVELNDRTPVSLLGCGSMPELDRNVIPFAIQNGDRFLALTKDDGSVPTHTEVEAIVSAPESDGFAGEFILFQFQNREK